jgi:hypothetical protein
MEMSTRPPQPPPPALSPLHPSRILFHEVVLTQVAAVCMSTSCASSLGRLARGSEAKGQSGKGIVRVQARGTCVYRTRNIANQGNVQDIGQSCPMCTLRKNKNGGWCWSCCTHLNCSTTAAVTVGNPVSLASPSVVGCHRPSFLPLISATTLFIQAKRV